MDDLRTKLGKAIMEAFSDAYYQHGENFNPDTCYAAADHVVALLVTELLDVAVVAKHHPSIIGPARFIASNADGAVPLPISDNYL